MAATKAEVELRIEEVLRIRLDGAQYHDVVQYASEKGWNISPRQVGNYIHRADDLLVERLEKKRKRIIATHLSRREALFARAVNAGDFRTGLAVLSDLAKLQNLYVAESELKSLVKLAIEQGNTIRDLEARLNAAAQHAPANPPPQPGADRPAGEANPESGSGRAAGPVEVPG